MPQGIKTTLDFMNVGRIVNLPDGVDPQDAATVHQLATGAGTALWGGIGGFIGDQTDLISGGKILASLLPAIGPTQGGTGLASYAKGDVLVATGTNTLGVVAASATDGYVFTWDATSGLPMWKAASGGGGVDTTADYTWTGFHTFRNSVTAGANNQILYAMYLNPSFNDGSYTGIQHVALYSTGALYFNAGGGATNIYMSGGGSIRGAGSTNSSFRLVPSLDGTGIIYIDGTTLAISSIINATGTSGQNTFSKGLTINTGTDILKSNAISLLGNKQTFDNINGLQIAWNKSGGSRENYIVSSASATSSDLGNAGDIMFGYWIGGTGGSLTTYGGWKKSGSFLIGTTTEASSSLLTLASTTKGFLPPRMTTTQKNAITSPAEGLVVYDNVLKKLCLYTGTAWETITSA